MTTTRALAYTRQSVGRPGESEETSLSLNAQLDRIQSHCAREGWQIVETVADHDLSGERWNRPGLQRLMDRVRAGGIDVVVVFAISRIARKVLHQEMVVDVLTEHGAQLVSVTEAGLDNILVRVVHAGMAEQHNANHRKILRATFETRARRGFHHGRAPFGYRHRVGGSKGLDIIPDQADLVREMFERRASGQGLTEISVWLRSTGVRSGQGVGAWYLKTVRIILSTPLYAGYSAYKGEIVGDIQPDHAVAIVDRDTWHRVQRSFDGRRIRRPSEKRLSWLDGLVSHSCGGRMSTYTSSKGETTFRCNRSSYAGNVSVKCHEGPLTIVVHALEQSALRCLSRDLSDVPIDADAIVQAWMEANGRHESQQRRQRLERQRTALVEQIVRAEQMVTTGRRDFVWFDSFDQDVQARISAIDTELATFETVPTVADVELRIRAIAEMMSTVELLELNPAAARRVIERIGQIRYAGGWVSIEYSLDYTPIFLRPTRVKPVFDRARRVWEFHYPH